MRASECDLQPVRSLAGERHDPKSQHDSGHVRRNRPRSHRQVFLAPGWVNTTDSGDIALLNYAQIDPASTSPYVMISVFDLGVLDWTLPSACSNDGCDEIQVITTLCTNSDTNSCLPGDPNYGTALFRGVRDKPFCRDGVLRGLV